LEIQQEGRIRQNGFRLRRKARWSGADDHETGGLRQSIAGLEKDIAAQTSSDKDRVQQLKLLSNGDDDISIAGQHIGRCRVIGPAHVRADRWRQDDARDPTHSAADENTKVLMKNFRELERQHGLFQSSIKNVSFTI
jgi:hypothetical protein